MTSHVGDLHSRIALSILYLMFLMSILFPCVSVKPSMILNSCLDLSTTLVQLIGGSETRIMHLFNILNSFSTGTFLSLRSISASNLEFKLLFLTKYF